jgi:hypothetical protein
MVELPPNPNTSAEETTTRRPTLLTVLCILTFIGSGMNLFSSMFIATFYDSYTEIVRMFAEKFDLSGIEAMLEAKPAFFLVTGLFYAGSLSGAVLMFRLKKTGFHVYTVCQILLILAPMYFLHLPSPGLFEMLFSGIFVLLYGINLKFMT